MEHMNIQSRLDYGRQYVVRGVDVVVYGVALMPCRLHRVRGSTLLSEVHDSLGLLGMQEPQQTLVVLRHVEVLEADLPSRDLLPGGSALGHGADRGEGLGAQLLIDDPAGQ